jgi:L-fucose dehydrogenase
MDLGLRNKMVFVAGGAKGIGSAIAGGCAEEGALPVAVDNDARAREQIQRELRDARLMARFLPWDLTSSENCKAMAEPAAQACGRIDALVNNAGMHDQIGTEHGSPSKFVPSLGRNLLYYFALVDFAFHHLKHSHGPIVNHFPDHGDRTGQHGRMCAVQGILGLTHEWAAELPPFGRRVNVLVPAVVRTSLYRQWCDTFADAEQLKKVIFRMPLKKRGILPDEIRAMVIFLISYRAVHTTGQDVFVHGGYVRLDRALT